MRQHNGLLQAQTNLKVVTNAGGPGIACADACEAAGLTVDPIPTKTRRMLARLLPREATTAAPRLARAPAPSPAGPRRPRPGRNGYRERR